MSITNRIKEIAQEIYPEIVSIRRRIHSKPELSFFEFETSEFVKEKLTAWGILFTGDYVKTGIVAHVKGKTEGKTIALRADLDALPIMEMNTVEYISKRKGIMHACGHDVHTACLLGALFVLNELKEEWNGQVQGVFQPGEEKLPGGAKLMLKEGALKNPAPEAIFGQHVFPELKSGQVGFRPGMYMASCDEVYVTVKGKGGHGALPHKNIDPILIASHIIVGLQQLVSRKANPTTPTVLSFGKIEGLGATNVIPNEVKIAGTFRTMDEKWRAEAHQHIVQIAEDIAKSMGGECEAIIDKGYPFLMNDEKETMQAQNWAREYLGSENVVDLPIRMTGEDFSYYTQHMAGCFYRLGTADHQGGKTAPVHNAHFDIDEKALETGVGLMAYIALKRLS